MIGIIFICINFAKNNFDEKPSENIFYSVFDEFL